MGHFSRTEKKTASCFWESRESREGKAKEIESIPKTKETRERFEFEGILPEKSILMAYQLITEK